MREGANSPIETGETQVGKIVTMMASDFYPVMRRQRRKKKKKSFDMFVRESMLKNPGNLFDDEALEMKTEEIQLGSSSAYRQAGGFAHL